MTALLTQQAPKRRRPGRSSIPGLASWRLRAAAAHTKGMTDSTARQPKGIPTGGRFAPSVHAEPEAQLGRPFGAFTFDPDGTEWDEADPGDWPWAESGTAMIESGQVNGVGILIEAGPDGSAPSPVRWHVVDYRRGAKVRTGEAATLEQAKEDAKEERYRLARYAQGHRPLQPGARTPWGAAQHTAPVAAGMDVCSTAGHGGWKVSAARNRDIDPRWRRAGGWYEHDCDWAIPAITHWRDVPAEQLAEAHRVARRYFPEQYDAVVGKDPAKHGIAGYTPATKES